MVEKLATEFCRQTYDQLKQQLAERKPELDVKVHKPSAVGHAPPPARSSDR